MNDSKKIPWNLTKTQTKTKSTSRKHMVEENGHHDVNKVAKRHMMLCDALAAAELGQEFTVLRCF